MDGVHRPMRLLFGGRKRSSYVHSSNGDLSILRSREASNTEQEE